MLFSNVRRSYSYTRLVYGWIVIYGPIVRLLLAKARVSSQGDSDRLILKRCNAELWPRKYSQFYIFYTARGAKQGDNRPINPPWVLDSIQNISM